MTANTFESLITRVYKRIAYTKDRWRGREGERERGREEERERGREGENLTALGEAWRPRASFCKSRSAPPAAVAADAGVCLCVCACVCVWRAHTHTFITNTYINASMHFHVYEYLRHSDTCPATYHSHYSDQNPLSRAVPHRPSDRAPPAPPSQAGPPLPGPGRHQRHQSFRHLPQDPSPPTEQHGP